MREIIFRGKRIDNGEWVYGCYVFQNGKHIIFDKNTTWHYYIDESTVGQYTGLTDRNGKKIFEGDIVKHYHDRKFPESYSKGAIFWNEEYLRWKRTSENFDCCLANDCVYEVIGNIHDNPELLK